MSKRLIILAGVLSLSMVFTGCGRQAQDDQSVVVESQVVPVEVSQVVSDEVYDSIYGIGEIGVSETHQVNALATGTVTEVYFEVGDYVNEGDVLFKIETEDFEVDKNTSLTQASNSMNQAKLSLDNAKSNYERTLKLYNSGISSQSELDQMKSSYDNARISYSTAVTSYNSAKHSYDSLSENYEMTSPVSGIITGKSIIKDMMATQQNGYTIGVIDAYKVSSKIGSKYIGDVILGQEVEVYIPTLDRIVPGEIVSVSQSGTLGTYPVEINLMGDLSDFRAGMYAEYWIIKDKSSNGLWIPSMALMQENGESFVYTVIDGKANKVMVEVLSMRGEDIAIKSDLTKDQGVITFGKEYVMQGTEVQIR